MRKCLQFLLVLGVLLFGATRTSSQEDPANEVLVEEDEGIEIDVEDDEDEDLDEEGLDVDDEEDMDLDDEEDMDFDDEEDMDLDDDSASDPWDNTEDLGDMDVQGGLPESVFAVMHVNGAEIGYNIRQFMQEESTFYPTLSIADVNADTPVMLFFATERDKLHNTVTAAIEAGKMTEEDSDKILVGESLRRDIEALASAEIADLDVDDIKGLLADHNVNRNDDDEDLFALDEDLSDGVEDGSEDAGPEEPVKPKRKKRNWRERRAERKKKEEEDKKKQKDEFNPLYTLNPDVGLQVPSWGLALLGVAGLGGIGFLVFMLYRVLQETKDREDHRRVKQEQRLKRQQKSKKKRS